MTSKANKYRENRPIRLLSVTPKDFSGYFNTWLANSEYDQEFGMDNDTAFDMLTNYPNEAALASLNPEDETMEFFYNLLYESDIEKERQHIKESRL